MHSTRMMLTGFLILSACGSAATKTTATTSPPATTAEKNTTTSSVVAKTTTTVRHVKVVPTTTTVTSTTTTTETPTTVLSSTTVGTSMKQTNGANGDYHSWSDWPAWHCVGRNEQGGSGSYDTYGDGIAWGGSPAGGLPSSGYPGGLGIMRQAWDEARGAAGVSVTNGAYASPGDQIKVGRVILSRFGWHAWAEATLQKCGLG